MYGSRIDGVLALNSYSTVSLPMSASVWSAWYRIGSRYTSMKRNQQWW